MKRLSNIPIMVLIIFLTLFSCNEKKNTEKIIPENIKSKFKQTFPDAVNVKWEKSSDDTEWEADFIMSGSKQSARYTSDGKWFETEYEIVISKIPEAIKTKIASMYPEYKIIKAEVVSTNSGKKYEIKLNKGQENIAVYYNEEGIFIKQGKED